ncbi:MAG: DoxX family protein [Burkholderiales bacterium]|nr:DoxX family protein [Burkholderiales bacterium]
MLNNLQNPLALVGRILLALMFVLAGFSKIGGFEGTAGYIASKGLPAASLLAALTIVLEVGGGLAIMLGLFTRWSALALAGFTLLASFIFHAYWSLPAEQQMMEQLMFMKNMSIVGGLLVLAAFGAGAISVDAKRGK